MIEYALIVKLPFEEEVEYRFFGDIKTPVRKLAWYAQHYNPERLEIHQVMHDEYGEEIGWMW